MARDDGICFLTAVELAAAIRERELGAVEVVEAFLERIGRVNPALNAYVTLSAEGALEAARRADAKTARGRRLAPLHGVPFSAKDLVFTAGGRTTAGSPPFASFVPPPHAPAVAPPGAP